MYLPNPGDIVVLEVETDSWYQPREQQHLLVISNDTFHKFTEMAIVCPIIQDGNPSPLHINCDKRTKTKGMIYCEHLKTIDIRTRTLTFKEKISQEILTEVRDIIFGIMEKEE
ncbi:type II toxin-antitoxin system PemK/MazF family toxin [Gracilibacillus xinjiangensis]|uniref:Type II toxin-antitoxin system PemK/MazF family toxin n=1 Tax=Gracilibacillus xinjiangensis TaxID=1193282 RepID=A0ABV8WQ71_9BACI